MATDTGPVSVDLNSFARTKGTGWVPTDARITLEPAQEASRLLSTAFNQRRVNEDDFVDDVQFINGILPGYTFVRYRRRPGAYGEIRIYGHPSGAFYSSFDKFVPHVMAYMRLYPGECTCACCNLVMTNGRYPSRV